MGASCCAAQRDEPISPNTIRDASKILIHLQRTNTSDISNFVFEIGQTPVKASNAKNVEYVSISLVSASSQIQSLPQSSLCDLKPEAGNSLKDLSKHLVDMSKFEEGKSTSKVPASVSELNLQPGNCLTDLSKHLVDMSKFEEAPSSLTGTSKRMVEKSGIPTNAHHIPQDVSMTNVMFSRIDSNGSNTVTFDEMAESVSSVFPGLITKKKALKKLMKYTETNNIDDQEMSLEEFREVWDVLMDSLFDLVDENRNVKICISELESYFKKKFGPLVLWGCKGELKDTFALMIEYADIDKDRELNRSELKIIAESLLSEKVRIDDLTSSGIRFLLNRLKK